MSQAATQPKSPWLSRMPLLSHVAGAIFTKELRVSARRLRFYLLRMIYVGLLTLFVAVAWSSAVGGSFGAGAFMISRMAEAGKIITMTVLWFQFIAVQLAAMVLLSDSVSGEVYARTIGIILTTPLTSWQLVVGKLLSRLLHLLVLVVLSLPLLAIVRLFGGVPWATLTAGICISLAAAVFAGTVTMFYSTMFRKTYAIILLAMATLFVLYFVLPMMLGLVMAVMAFSGGQGSDELAEVVGQVLVHMHPYGAMSMVSAELGSPGSVPFLFYRPVHCAIMLAFSAGLLGLCSKLVRRVTFRRAAGGQAAGRSSRALRPTPVAPRAPLAAPPRSPVGSGAAPPPPLAAAPARPLSARRRARPLEGACNSPVSQPDAPHRGSGGQSQRSGGLLCAAGRTGGCGGRAHPDAP